MTKYRVKPLPTHAEESLYEERPLAKRVHVYPLGDMIEHDTSGRPCICVPQVEYPVTGGCLVTHNQLQGKEDGGG